MAATGLGCGAGHYNPDEPRDWHGRWTGGGAGCGPGKANRTRLGPGNGERTGPAPAHSVFERTKAILDHATRELEASFSHAFRLPDPKPELIERYQHLFDAWSRANALDDKTFQDRYIGRDSPKSVGSFLRLAAKLYQEGTTPEALRNAGVYLGAAARSGLNSGGLGPIRDWFRNPHPLETLAKNAPPPAPLPPAPPPPPTDPEEGGGREAGKAQEASSPSAPEEEGAATAKSAPRSGLLTMSPAQRQIMTKLAVAALRGARGRATDFLGALVTSTPTGVEGAGELPDGRSYRWLTDEHDPTLEISGWFSPTETYKVGRDGIIRAIGHGETVEVGWVKDGVAIIDTNAASNINVPVPESLHIEATSESEPRLCPKETPDRKGHENRKDKKTGRNFIMEYEDHVKKYVNPEDPTPTGMGYAFINPETGKDVVFDDCDKKTGDLIEAKGPTYTRLLTINEYTAAGTINNLLGQAGRQVRAAHGRRLIWYFAQPTAAEIAREAFKREKYNIDVRVLPMEGIKQ